MLSFCRFDVEEFEITVLWPFVSKSNRKEILSSKAKGFIFIKRTLQTKYIFFSA
jgi:hypothetical protein